MIDLELSSKIGAYLKRIRKDKKFSAKDVGIKLGYSQSHISGIENGTKVIPNTRFIENYFLYITKSNFSEINFYLNEVNEKADGLFDFPTYIDQNTSLMNAFAKNFEEDTSKINSIEYETPTGDTKKEYYDFPINDLKYNLTDMHNGKYFNRIILSPEDREHINNYIESYIELKYKIYLNQLNDLFTNQKINKSDYDKEYYQIDRILKTLKGQPYGKL